MHTSIRIKDDLYERIQEWCEKHDRTVSYLIKKAVEQYLSSSESDS